MGLGRRWRREVARGRLLGAGSYGLLAAISERLAAGKQGAREGGPDGRSATDGAPWPPQAGRAAADEPAPFQHRSELEPGRRRGEETRPSRLKEEKQRFS